MWKFVLQEFTNVITTKRLFIIYSTTTFPTKSLQTIMNITSEYDYFSEIIYEQMKAANEEQALNICSKILSQCAGKDGLEEGCLVANVVERSYQKILYKHYHQIVKDTDKYPIISVYLDENIIDNEWENVYIYIYYYLV